MREYLRVLRKSWVVLLVAMVAGGAAGVSIGLSSTPEYSASSRVYVSVRSTDAMGSADLNQGTTFARQAVTSYLSVIRSAIVLDRVVDELSLKESAESLAGRVSVSSPTNSVLIDIVATDPSPGQAARIANTVGAAFATVVTDELEKPANGTSPISVKTIQPAVVPAAPSAPNVPALGAIGAIACLSLGVAFAIVRKLLDTRLRSANELEQIAHKPFLAALAYDSETVKSPLVVERDPRSPRAEAFRRLRTSLQYATIGAKNSALVVTSAGPGEGKSNVAANLAITLAETGARVIVVDGDLRRPMLARNFGLIGSTGLTDILAGRAELRDVVQTYGEYNLDVLAAGAIPPNPSELLGSRAMKELINDLTAHYDFVVIDAPPSLLVADAAILSSLASVLLVAAVGKARKTEIAASVRSLEAVNAHILGAIATMVPAKGPDATAYGAYTYYGAATPATSEGIRRRTSRG